MVHRSRLLMFAVVLALASSSAHAATFTATLLGSNETPPNASTATGTALVTLNGNLLTVDESFSGLIGGAASAAHIHCCEPPGTAAGVAVPFPFSGVPSFPAATSGTYMNTFDLTLAATYLPAFLTAHGGTAAGAEAFLIAGLDSGLAYVNIHNATFPGGEIRGQLEPIPLPAALPLFATGLAGLGLLRWRRKRKAQAIA
jgi:CHRD domain